MSQLTINGVGSGIGRIVLAFLEQSKAVAWPG
jgi:hypothetical protein